MRRSGRWLSVALVVALGAGGVARAEHEGPQVRAAETVAAQSAQMRLFLEVLVDAMELEDMRRLLFLLTYVEDESLVLPGLIEFHRLWWGLHPSVREEVMLNLDAVWYAWRPETLE